MKITPLEIRQKAFEKNFRGYNQDEVNGFLQTLSQEWERIYDENKELRIKLEATEREVLKLREVESSLYKTLKTAEDTGANVIEQARQSAELNMRESQLNAEAMLNEAKTKARNLIEESESRSKNTLVEMEERLKTLVESYKKLESTRDDLLQDLKRISQDNIERVERIKNSTRNFDVDKYAAEAKSGLQKTISPNVTISNTATLAESKPTPAPIVLQSGEEFNVEQQAVVETGTRKVKSFFDEIE
jgi:cell division initiation protein